MTRFQPICHFTDPIDDEAFSCAWHASDKKVHGFWRAIGAIEVWAESFKVRSDSVNDLALLS